MSDPKGLSLHIGLNSVDPQHYAGWSGPLVACEADADEMHDIARRQGYTPILLKGAAATRAAVMARIREAAKALSSGDICFVTYSGHGGQLPDLNGDEFDLQDETWCLYDGELIDDELHLLWSEFAAGVRILLLSDSCHSGTVAKEWAYSRAVGVTPLEGGAGAEDEPPRYRAMPPSVALRTYRQNRAFYDELGAALPKESLPVEASVRLFSGCQDNQLSRDGAFNGLFTGTLLRVWAGGRFKGDYARFHYEIQSRMPPTQSPNHFSVGVLSPEYDRQRPFQIKPDEPAVSAG